MCAPALKLFDLKCCDDLYEQKPKERTSLILENEPKFVICFYNQCENHRQIWSYNIMLRKKWSKEIEDGQYSSIDNNCLPLEDIDVRVMGVIKHHDLVRVLSIRRKRSSSDDSSSYVHGVIFYKGNLGASKIQNSSVPFPTHTSNLVQCDDYYYALVSISSHPGPHVFRFNLKSSHWEMIYRNETVCPHEPGENRKIFTDGKNIYYFRSDEPGNPSITKVSAFNLVTHQWNVLDTLGDDQNFPKYPDKRQNFSVGYYKNPLSSETFVVLSGGAASPDRKFCDVWKFQINDLKWICLSRLGLVLPYNMQNHLSTVTSLGQLIIFGEKTPGAENPAELTSRSIYSAWLKNPDNF